MIRQTHSRRPGRSGFTLIELLVVIAIIAVLVGLTVVAVSGTASNAKRKVTRALVQKLQGAVDAKWKEVLRTVSVGSVDPTFLAYASNDTTRAIVMHKALALKRNFPMTYAEAQSSGYFKNELAKKNPNVATDPRTESAACLLMALKRPITGVQFNVEEVLGGGAIKDTDGDGIDEIVDGWGNPIQFYRWTCLNADVQQALAADDPQGPKDPLDRDRKLLDVTWHQGNSVGVKFFQDNFYPITIDPSTSGSPPQAYYSKAIIVSMGRDEKLGLGAYALITDATQANDNIYSFKEK